jgi:prophage antirepressor-like protein
MSNVVQMFKFQNNEVNVIEDNTEIWFKAKDVCDAVGIKNSSTALNGTKRKDKNGNEYTSGGLDSDEKATYAVHTQFGDKDASFVSEPGLYHLLNNSSRPEAKPFQRWVNHEVLPSIRKHGAYMTDEAVQNTLTDPDYLIKLATVLKQEKEARIKAERESNEKTIILAKQQPLVDFAKSIQISKNDISVKDLAGLLLNQIVKIGRNDLFDWLRENKYLCSAYSNKNKPSQKSLNLKIMTYKESTINTEYGNTYTVFTPKITSKGQLYFVTKFKKLKEENKLNI